MNKINPQDESGSAYYLCEPQPDLDMVSVVKGTPGGELLRRYWHPVAVASEVGDLPVAVRALGEDLILFKTPRGEFGLVYPRCCHRGTTLYYGKVEDCGIRCCYHGWLFSPDGRCLDQPCEPNGGDKRDNYRQPWYPVRELYGLVFAYLGPPDRKPALPRYDIMENLDQGLELVADGTSWGSGGPNSMPCNWFQTHENVMDPAHVGVLHKDQFPVQMTDRSSNREGGFELTEYGMLGGGTTKFPDGSMLRFSAELVMPNIRIVPDPFLGSFGKSDEMQWTLPIDDTNTRIFTVFRISIGGVPPNKRRPANYSGKTWFDLDAQGHQRNPGDFEAQVGQGAITLHSEERLASSDRGVAMFRRIYRESIRTVQEGGDPPNARPEDFVVRVRAAAEFTPAPASGDSARVRET
ncbi:MAG: Rieske 2Fe-2S domain-containing protein [Candidatus Binataceae bacterium]